MAASTAVPHRCISAFTPPDATRRVYVASKNIVKIQAVERAVQKCFPQRTFTFQAEEASSGVPEQPFGDYETKLGAVNRVAALQAKYKQGLLVAIEGGVGRRPDGATECFAWVVVTSAETGVESVTRSASFDLPPPLVAYLEEGLELGVANDRLFGQKASGKGRGTVGTLSKGLITRTDYYEHATALALIPFQNPELYGDAYRL